MPDTLTHTAAKLSEHAQSDFGHYASMMGSVHEMIEAFWQRVPYLLLALLLFIVFWLFAKIFKKLAVRLLSARLANRLNLLLVLQRIGSALIIFTGFLIAMMVAIPGFTPGQLVSALGIGSVAIGFAFKDIFQNLLSGILILLSEPFRIGDDIVVNGLEGNVEDIQIRATFLRSPDGRRIVIPNATVYTSAVIVNSAYQRRRCEFVVGIGYEDDIQKAKKIILDILNNNMTVLSQPAFSVNVTALADFSINLTVRWWVNTTETSTSASISEIQELVVTAFDEKGISIPYPVQEVKVYRGDQSDNTENLDKQTT